MLKFKRFKEKTKLSSKGSRVLGPCGDLVVAIYFEVNLFKSSSSFSFVNGFEKKLFSCLLLLLLPARQHLTRGLVFWVGHYQHCRNDMLPPII